VKIAGETVNVDGMYLRIICHDNEHMGQLIAYARIDARAHFGVYRRLVLPNALGYEIEGWIMLLCHGHGGRSCGKEQDET
jgi:hypothetical protein